MYFVIQNSEFKIQNNEIMYKITDFNATSISINGLLYSKNHNAIQASPGRISIVSISDENDFVLYNEPVTGVMIEGVIYPNEREFIMAFEPLKKSDSSGGATSGDIVDAINSLKDTLITESDETQTAIEDLKTPLIEVPFAIESLAPQEQINEVIPVAVELDKSYDVSIADGYNDTNIVETVTLVDDNIHLNIHYTGSGALKPAKTIIIKIKEII